jgi:hypothetical protein
VPDAEAVWLNASALPAAFVLFAGETTSLPVTPPASTDAGQARTMTPARALTREPHVHAGSLASTGQARPGHDNAMAIRSLPFPLPFAVWVREGVRVSARSQQSTCCETSDRSSMYHVDDPYWVADAPHV